MRRVCRWRWSYAVAREADRLSGWSPRPSSTRRAAWRFPRLETGESRSFADSDRARYRDERGPVVREELCEGTTVPVDTRLAASGWAHPRSDDGARRAGAGCSRRRSHAPAQRPGLAGRRPRHALERARRALGSPLGQCGDPARARAVVRAREAVVRISDESTEFDKIKRVEVYAEGQVRSARTTGSPSQRPGRVANRAKSGSSAISPDGRVRGEESARGSLQIIRRSGLRDRSATAAVPSRAERADRDASPIDSRLEILTRRAASVREQPAATSGNQADHPDASRCAQSVRRR